VYPGGPQPVECSLDLEYEACVYELASYLDDLELRAPLLRASCCVQSAANCLAVWHGDAFSPSLSTARKIAQLLSMAVAAACK
jgi:hypothetical protein